MSPIFALADNFLCSLYLKNELYNIDGLSYTEWNKLPWREGRRFIFKATYLYIIRGKINYKISMLAATLRRQAIKIKRNGEYVSGWQAIKESSK
jgi:hypothetical protein